MSALSPGRRASSGSYTFALMQAARDMGIAKSDAMLMFDGIMILREDVHASYAQQNAPMDLSGIL